MFLLKLNRCCSGPTSRIIFHNTITLSIKYILEIRNFAYDNIFITEFLSTLHVAPTLNTQDYSFRSSLVVIVLLLLSRPLQLYHQIKLYFKMIRPILMRMMTMLQQSCGKKYCRIGFASCLVLLVIIISIVVRNNNNDYEYAPYQIPQPYHHHPDTGKYVIPNQYVIIFYSNVEGASYDIGDGILQRYQKQYPTDYKNEMPTIIHDYDSVYKGVTIMNVSDNLLQYILQEQVVKHIDEVNITYCEDRISQIFEILCFSQPFLCIHCFSYFYYDINNYFYCL